MNKVISGSKYDTETAKRLGAWSNRSDSRDFSYCSESLYRTKSGKYFLYGEGGPMSRYASHSSENSWGYGEKIIPMSRAEAQEWAEEHLDGDEYEEIFGIVEEDGKEQFNITISAALKAKLWELAEKKRTSISAMVEEVLTKLVE